MANYKLTNDYWETSGVYDITQGKTQREINNTLVDAVQTESVVDKVPYAFRKTGGDNTVGKREMDKLVGGTVVWNQGFGVPTTISKTGGTTSIENGVVTFTAAAKDNQAYLTLRLVVGHVFLASLSFKTSSATSDVHMRAFSTNAPATATTEWQRSHIMHKAPNGATAASVGVQDSRTSGWDAIQIKEFQVFDLTDIFGSTIANYIYSLETATAGAGVAFFRSLFPNSYYAYNAGTLMSVNAARHEMVGFNQFNKSTSTANKRMNSGAEMAANGYSHSDYFRVVPNNTFYGVGYLVSSVGEAIDFYDINKTYLSRMYTSTGNISGTIPSNAYYAVINYASADADTVRFSYSRAVEGQDISYTKNTYPLDSTLTLRGIPKLDSNNKLYYDGDTYESDGTVTRKWAETTVSFTSVATASNGMKYGQMGLNPAGIGETGSNGILEGYQLVTGLPTADKTFRIAGINVYVYDNTFTDLATANSAISGKKLVYKLGTPTTASASPYTNPQICDGGGTEEYVDAGVLAEERDVSVPVGHETEYMTETASNSAGWETDYSTMIAPTEKDFTATRAYSTNNLFIISGQLYKATSSIASGAAITVGTNCAKTTIGEILTTLLNA